MSALEAAEEMILRLKVEEEGCSKGHSLWINDEEWACVAPSLLQRAESDTEQ